jgi:two-component system, cell cycle response regulator DivK
MNNTSRNVLIIDDDNRNIFALKAVLKAKGFDCLTATGGMDGLRQLSTRNDIGVVLLDMMMPDMDGYETISKIREGPAKGIVVISVTAQAMVGDKEKCLKAGANAYISKPIDIERLIVLLNRYLEQ